MVEKKVQKRLILIFTNNFNGHSINPMSFIYHFGRYLIMLKGMFSKPENPKLYWKEFMHQCSEIGIGSLGIVWIICVFFGAVSAFKTAYQLVNTRN